MAVVCKGPLHQLKEGGPGDGHGPHVSQASAPRAHGSVANPNPEPEGARPPAAATQAAGGSQPARRRGLATVEKALSDLEARWPRGEEVLSSAWSHWPQSDGGAALRAVLDARLKEGGPFVFASFGSSVTAGHDNFPNQSWPFALERLLKPTFEALGSGFEARNRASGGWGEMPFAAGCLATRAGRGVDAVSWEYRMFHDPPCEGFEFLHEAFGLERSPVVFALKEEEVQFGHMTVDGEARKDARKRLLRYHDDMIGSNKGFHPNEWFATEAFVSQSELQAWETWAKEVNLTLLEESRKFLESILRGSNGHWLVTSGAAKKFTDAGKGFYSISPFAASLLTVERSWYQVREKALNLNWHPGPLGHLLVASQVAHYILTQLRQLLSGAAQPRQLDEHEGPNPVVNAGGTLHKDESCGKLVTLQCSTGMDPFPPEADLIRLRAPESQDKWVQQISRQAREGPVKSVDRRHVLSGNTSSGELLLAVEVPEGARQAYSLFCAAPCGWGCQPATGYVAAISQRWWSEKIAGGLKKTTVGRGPDGKELTTEEILEKIGFVKERKNASDVAFTIDGVEVPHDELVDLHQRLFGKRGGIFCPGCKSSADICQPVGPLKPGRHLLGLRVHPRTFEASDMVIEIMQMTLVGEPPSLDATPASPAPSATLPAPSSSRGSAGPSLSGSAGPPPGATEAAGISQSTRAQGLAIVEKALADLEASWPRGEKVLSSAWNVWPQRDGGAALRAVLDARLKEGGPFVFVSFGSSVTAGHDNWPNQSYPFALERLLKPTFEALGFGFETRNRASGGWGEMPFAAGCLATRAGRGVDAVSWEYHMFHDAPCEGFEFLTEVSSLERRPVVFGFTDTALGFAHFFNVDDNGRRDARQRLLRFHDDMLGASRGWHPNEWFASEAFVSQSELQAWEAWVKEKPMTVDQINRNHLEKLSREGNRQWLVKSGAARRFVDAGLGFYTITTSAASLIANELSWYQAREKALNFNWHPGPLGHLLVASQVAHYMLTQLRQLLSGAPPPRQLAVHEGPNPVVNAGGELHKDESCGKLVTLQCRTGLEPFPPEGDLTRLRAPESQDRWVQQLSRHAREGPIKAIDRRHVFSGNPSSGELLLAVEVPEGASEAYALLCSSPCGWSCVGATGYVAAVSQRWWHPAMLWGGLSTSSVARGPDGKRLSKEEVLKKVGFVSEYTRKDASDVAFTVDGVEVPHDTLLQLHRRLFAKPGGIFCPGCKSSGDLCQPVGPLEPGRRLIGLRVHPRTFEAPDMGIEIMQMTLVGEPPSPAALSASPAPGRAGLSVPSSAELSSGPTGAALGSQPTRAQAPVAPPASTAPGCKDRQGTGDLNGDGCGGYSTFQSWCVEGKFDDSDFTASVMCCVCGGGQVPETHSSRDSPAGTTRTPSANPTGVVATALEQLERAWPKGREVLERAFSKIPAPDGGAKLRERLRARLDSKEVFVFAAFGSSVTAGHNNYFNQTWPLMLERTLRPIFEEMGFGFEVRNFGEGGWAEAPFSSGCLAAKMQGGEDVDALSWEWWMFHDPACEGHLFLREAASLARQPVVFAFADTGLEFESWLTVSKKDRWNYAKSSMARWDKVGEGKDWVDNAWYLTDEYISAADLELWKKWVDRSRLSVKTSSFGPAANRDRQWLQQTGVINNFVKEGLGYYPLAVSAPSKLVVGDPWYQTRELALNINWHPGPLGQLLIAHMLGHYILKQLADVLDGATPRLLQSGAGPTKNNPLVGSATPIKVDAKCGNMESLVCLTGAEPRPESIDLRLARSKESSDTWERKQSAHARVPPKTGMRDLRMVYSGTNQSGELLLQVKVPEASPRAFALLCEAPCGWSCDGAKGYISAVGQKWWNKGFGNSMLGRRSPFVRKADGTCCLSKEEVAKKLGSENENTRRKVSDVTFTVDGRTVSQEQLLELHQQLFGTRGSFCPGCTNIQSICQPVGPLMPGHHLIGLRVQPRSYDAAEMVVELLQLMLVGEKG